MDTKSYLSQVYKLDKAIKFKKAELESYNELSLSISGSNYDEHFNSTRNIEPAFVRFIDKAMDIENEIKADLARLAQLKYKLGAEIDKLSDTNERLILRYRYLLCMSWGEIAEKLNYSKRWVHKICNEALEHFEKLDTSVHTCSY